MSPTEHLLGDEGVEFWRVDGGARFTISRKTTIKKIDKILFHYVQ
jgi:hypothetical protein